MTGFSGSERLSDSLNGKFNETVVPTFSVLAISIDARICAAKPKQIASPNPVP